MRDIEIAVIGGSGLYDIADLTKRTEIDVQTPFGSPSDLIRTGCLGDTPIGFLARHGRGHRLIPSEIPFRANIHALRALGVRYVIAVSAVGSLREHIRPLDIVIPDQFVDLTRQRSGTFFGDGAVAHVSMADPVCPAVSRALANAAGHVAQGSVQVHGRGTYVCIEGPAFSSRAESQWFRSFGADVIGMTAMPEAKLAREAGIAYGTLALVTDYDCWHPREASVTANLALANLSCNAERARQILMLAVTNLARSRPPSSAHHALASALVTPLDTITAETRERLRPLLG